MARINKYRNVLTTIGSRTFGSAAEARRYVELSALERAGEIERLRCQVPFVLAPSVLHPGTVRRTPTLRYFADFVYVDSRTGRQVVEDVKGKLTEGYRIKRHLMAAAGNHITEIRA
jgi:hypothetical protein